ncbi:MAG: phosphoenolpyruvate synthase, partial [Planctomycetota bacterium]
VNPDEYRVFKPLLDAYRPIIQKTVAEKDIKLVYSGKKGQPTRQVDTDESERNAPCLSDDEVLTLGRWAKAIEAHYGKAMDIEWARDGESRELYIVQARPETVQSQKAAQKLHTYKLTESGKQILEGLGVGSKIAAGKVFLMSDPEEGERFEPGGILVTEMTNPDWGPIMKRAGGIVTNSGGRTSHAAIVSRELGVPAVVGTDTATETLQDGQEVTVDCSSGESGRVYDGKLAYQEREIDTSDLPETKTQIMMILASPDAAFQWWNLPTRGVGLARMEFIVNNVIKIHPLALTRFDQLEDDELRQQIEQLTAGYEDKSEYFVDHLARGIASIAAPSYPHKVIVRLSDFKTNEYADLIGGSAFEPAEANPMLGFRGASRYYSDRYRDGFELECRAIKRVREEMGLSNVVVMVPFCRTLAEADRVLETMGRFGLARGAGDLNVYVMAEIPSNVVLAREFADRFDGFSIGTNDLTQLVLGVDRDSEQLQHLFDARNEAVKQMVRDLIDRAHEKHSTVGICGQAPSDHPDFGEFLVQAGIDTISVNPDSVVDIIHHVARAEQQQ